jgi:hypothetical protein
MTIDYTIDAMYEIRKHLWEELKTHKLFKASDYYIDSSGIEIIPIIPVQQQPELNQFLSGKSHIVYDKTGLSYEDNWMICCEKLLFTIYSTDVSEINAIRNLMLDVFRRMDDSAKELNKSRDTDKIIFFNTLVLEITPTEPSQELQGFLSTDVMLEVKYARTTDRLGRFD